MKKQEKKSSKKKKKILSIDQFIHKHESNRIKNGKTAVGLVSRFLARIQRNSLAWVMYSFPMVVILSVTLNYMDVKKVLPNALILPLSILALFVYKVKALSNIKYKDIYEDTLIKTVTGSAIVFSISLILRLIFSYEATISLVINPIMAASVIIVLSIIGLHSFNKDNYENSVIGTIISSSIGMKMYKVNSPVIIY